MANEEGKMNAKGGWDAAPGSPHRSLTREEVMDLIREMRKHRRPLEPGEDPTAFLHDPETGLPG